MENTLTQISDLPYELLRMIFSKLPLTSLVRSASLTCKLWHSVTKDPIFSDSYVSPSPGYLYARPGSSYARCCDLYFADNPTHVVKIRGQLLEDHESRYINIHSCHGLISYGMNGWLSSCCAIWICNPILNDHVELPSPNMRRLTWGFGYATLTKQYKCVCFSHAEYTYDVLATKIFSLGEKSWRDLAAPVPHKYFPYPFVYYDGALYWALNSTTVDNHECQYSVMSIDLNTEEYRLRHITRRESKLVPHLDYPIIFGETMALVLLDRNGVLRMWMLVDEAADIWEEKYCISLVTKLNLARFNLWGLWVRQETYGTEATYKIEGSYGHRDSRTLFLWNVGQKTNAELKYPCAEDADRYAELADRYAYDNRYFGYHSALPPLHLSHLGSFVSPSKIVKMDTDHVINFFQ